MSELRAEKCLLIRLGLDVHAAIVRAARERHITETKFIEQLLTVIVKDDLIDALLDDRLKQHSARPAPPKLKAG